MYIDLQFKVINQTIHPADKKPHAQEIVSDSIKYLHTQFTFNSEWDGLIKSAVFTPKGRTVWPTAYLSI